MAGSSLASHTPQGLRGVVHETRPDRIGRTSSGAPVTMLKVVMFVVERTILPGVSIIAADNIPAYLVHLAQELHLYQ